eukprot:TRINITY_DN6801_c0_g1_i2.p1 TRINITY_DN6801_c0_g1~~TRINITY_DN6801_c0_g1_i2.p1  ORF type:complete len:243 (-),score=82.53 TRINITY_DN6801_c0_g1_i2:377-1105(-)
MENSAAKNLLCFLAEEEKLSEQRLRMLNTLLDTTPPSTFPTHISDTLNLLRQNAEEDLSNILHIQSIFPSGLPKKAALSLPAAKPKHSPVKAVQAVFGDSRAVLGQVEEDIEAGVAVTDDLFLMEGVDASTSQLRSPQSAFSDEEREDSELDEGIHIPSKFSNKKTYEVAASLPVGIPWPVQMTSAPMALNREVGCEGGEERPRDIAASIQAMAKSVHTSSIFGDNTFGDLPRPRLNTFTKD